MAVHFGRTTQSSAPIRLPILDGLDVRTSPGRGTAARYNFNKEFHILRNSPKKPSRRIAVRPEVSKILDHAADNIRLAGDFYSRQCAIDEFKMICRDTQSAINPGREALR